MQRFFFPSSIYLCLALALLMLLLATLPESAFTHLNLERSALAQGEWWRLVTSNFVHFGWAHTFMNLAAFLLCTFALLGEFSAPKLTGLILFCCVCVSLGVYFFNPEYEVYAGLSGAIHGFIVAGLLANKRHSYWLNGLFIALVFAKIVYEHQANYQATELQALLPVAVAYDAHLYGALAGLVFGLGDLLQRHFIANKQR